MRQNLLFLTISVILLCPVWAFPQQYWTVSQLGVNGTSYDIGKDNNGNVHIIWLDGTELYYGKIVNGVVTGKETIPRGGTSVHTRFTRPRLGVRPDGATIHTTWIDAYGGGGRALRHAWRDAGGVWHNEQAWSSGGSYYIAYPAVGADLNGIVHVVAQRWSTSNTYYTIYGRKSGGTWSWYTIASGKPHQQVAYTDKNGGFHATWRSLGNPGEYRYCASGGNLSASPTLYVPVVPGTVTPSLGDLFVADNGDVHNAFLSFLSNGQAQVDYYVKRAGSNTFSELSHPSSGPYANCTDLDAWPAVIADNAGHVVVAYGEQTNCALNGFNRLIVALNVGGSWQRYTMDQNAFINYDSKPAMTVANNVGYLVWRSGNGSLKLARSSVEPSLKVISPNGSESWVVGSTYPITWTSEGTVGNVKIEYTKDNGVNWTVISGSTANDGSHTWTIPDTISSLCRVRIMEASDGSPSDTSDATFSIVNPGNSPQISLSHTQLNFGCYPGGPTPPSQSFVISNTRVGTLTWTASSSSGWLKCSPTSGTGSGLVTVSVDISGVSAGIYIGNITVSDPNASNSPQLLAVSLRVYSAGATAIPFGNFETPSDGSTVRSSIPVTGWALDDIGIDSVKLYRNEGGQLFYIGDALFVEGARPDVEAYYPTYPMSYRAGWGYMMLTNFLPNGGNGAFEIHAIVTDSEGNSVSLGSKTITCDNANAVKPFGAIDAPAPGGTASGSSFKNGGWVLTPLPNTIPTNGSTIDVYVDGVKLGNPKYNLYRSDIASLFPGYNNSSAAGGSFTLDTTAYKNGLHTINWIAADNAGNSDGIGSRYFNILNSGANRATSQLTCILRQPAADVPPRDFTGEPLHLKKGYEENTSPTEIVPDENGLSSIDIVELERIEIHLSEGTPLAELDGFLLAGNQLRPLPVGSTLDTERGIFYWQPGAGFLGEYRLMFIFRGTNGEMNRKDIMVTISPKY